ncbi:P-type DNA transfer ATPase VirB11, partial [Rhizobium leguminosarum]
MNARPSISAEQHFLSEAIEPIRPFLDDPNVVEISCQRSNEIWLERIGQLSMVRQDVDGLDQDAIRHMASRAASFTKQTVNAQHPLLSATLVNGERVQFVLNPTSATGHAFSIRKQFIRRFDLNDYEKAGAFRFTKVTGDDYIDDVDIELSR